MSHGFCQVSLRTAREMAKEAGVKLPTHITTWTDGHGQYQMFYRENGENITGRGYFDGDCAAEAKANFITSRIDRDAPNWAWAEKAGE